MAPVSNKRRRPEEDVRRPKKKIRVKKQKDYHSSSEDESEDDLQDSRTPKAQDAPRSILKQTIKPARQQRDDSGDIEGLDQLDEAERNAALNLAEAGADEDEDMSDVDAQIHGDEPVQSEDDDEADEDDEDTPSETSMTSSQASALRRKNKRNDPDAFATSINKILSTKLTTSKRADPVLSRSKAASVASKDLVEKKLDAAARAQIRAERRQALQKGRVTDLLGLEDDSVETGRMREEERRLMKIAQRGVVRLFNAVRGAQIGAEKAAKEAAGEVGRKAKEERVSEMSKEGFLEMISRGKAAAA